MFSPRQRFHTYSPPQSSRSSPRRTCLPSRQKGGQDQGQLQLPHCSPLWLPLVFLPACFMGWPVPPLVLPEADPSWGPSISSTLTSSGNISHSFTSLSPQAFPHQYTICFSSSPIICSPPSFYTLASAPTSTKPARVPHDLHVARLGPCLTLPQLRPSANGHALLLETTPLPASWHHSFLGCLLPS